MLSVLRIAPPALTEDSVRLVLKEMLQQEQQL